LVSDRRLDWRILGTGCAVSSPARVPGPSSCAGRVGRAGGAPGRRPGRAAAGAPMGLGLCPRPGARRAPDCQGPAKSGGPAGGCGGPWRGPGDRRAGRGSGAVVGDRGWVCWGLVAVGLLALRLLVRGWAGWWGPWRSCGGGGLVGGRCGRLGWALGRWSGGFFFGVGEGGGGGGRGRRGGGGAGMVRQSPAVAGFGRRGFGLAGRGLGLGRTGGASVGCSGGLWVPGGLVGRLQCNRLGARRACR
jgi:hypothetical protein